MSKLAGPSFLWEEICSRGYSKFCDESLIQRAIDPVELALYLFGRHPCRYQKTIIQPASGGNRTSLPRTMHAGALHNDCMQYGMPAQIQLMICNRQSSTGGDSLLLDLWPILKEIEYGDLDLYKKLFFKIRRMKPYFQNRFSQTISTCRGNLVCFHPGLGDDDPIGKEFQARIDASSPIRFRCEAGEAYVNNNHRMLHGRTSFTDESRQFIRLLYWFIEPLPAPASLLEYASKGTQDIASKIKYKSFWIKQHLGVDAPKFSPEIHSEFSFALAQFLQPQDCNDWGAENFRRSRIQEALVSALWSVLSEPDFDDVEFTAICRNIQQLDA